MGFLHFYLRTDITLLVLKHHCLTLGWSWEKNYVKVCPFLPISSILKTVAATLTQLHAREEKIHGFLAFLLKNRHYFIGSKTSLSYIRLVMGEKLC